MRLLFTDAPVPVGRGIGAFVSQPMRAAFVAGYAVDELRVKAGSGGDLGAQRAQAGGGEGDLANLRQMLRAGLRHRGDIEGAQPGFGERGIFDAQQQVASAGERTEAAIS